MADCITPGIIDSSDLPSLLKLAEELACRHHDGHLTILRFTTHWKAMLGTPNLICGDYRTVTDLPTYPTLEQALASIIIQHCDA